MMAGFWRGSLAAVGLLFFSTPALAQATATASVNVTVTVNARAVLTLSSNAIAWGDADPDVVATFTSSPITVGARARTSGGSNVTLTVLADGPLTSGGNTIPISNLTWTASGAGFSAGAASSTTAQTLATFSNSGDRSGTQTYSLPNSWDYAAGTYTATLTYTLTAP